MHDVKRLPQWAQRLIAAKNELIEAYERRIDAGVVGTGALGWFPLTPYEAASQPNGFPSVAVDNATGTRVPAYHKDTDRALGKDFGEGELHDDA